MPIVHTAKVAAQERRSIAAAQRRRNKIFDGLEKHGSVHIPHSQAAAILPALKPELEQRFPGRRITYEGARLVVHEIEKKSGGFGFIDPRGIGRKVVGKLASEAAFLGTGIAGMAADYGKAGVLDVKDIATANTGGRAFGRTGGLVARDARGMVTALDMAIPEPPSFGLPRDPLKLGGKVPGFSPVQSKAADRAEAKKFWGEHPVVAAATVLPFVSAFARRASVGTIQRSLRRANPDLPIREVRRIAHKESRMPGYAAAHGVEGGIDPRILSGDYAEAAGRPLSRSPLGRMGQRAYDRKSEALEVRSPGKKFSTSQRAARMQARKDRKTLAQEAAWVARLEGEMRKAIALFGRSRKDKEALAAALEGPKSMTPRQAIELKLADLTDVAGSLSGVGTEAARNVRQVVEQMTALRDALRSDRIDSPEFQRALSALEEVSAKAEAQFKAIYPDVTEEYLASRRNRLVERYGNRGLIPGEKRTRSRTIEEADARLAKLENEIDAIVSLVAREKQRGFEAFRVTGGKRQRSQRTQGHMSDKQRRSDVGGGRYVEDPNGYGAERPKRTGPEQAYTWAEEQLYELGRGKEVDPFILRLAEEEPRLRELAAQMDELDALRAAINDRTMPEWAKDAPVAPPVSSPRTFAAERSAERQVPKFEDEIRWLKSPKGKPGITIEKPWAARFQEEIPGSRIIVKRDANGDPIGMLQVFDTAGEADLLSVVVKEGHRRQGVATDLYQAAERAGMNIRGAMGEGGYTAEGAAFANAFERRGAPTVAKTAPTEYPIAGSVVDGRTVRDHVPNMDSIAASLDNYTVLPGIREVPMSDFTLSGKHYSPEGNARIKELAETIDQSKEITPLIVVVDAEGSYILEGSTRVDALYNLNAKSFPAKVVVDEDSFDAIGARPLGTVTEFVPATGFEARGYFPHRDIFEDVGGPRGAPAFAATGKVVGAVRKSAAATRKENRLIRYEQGRVQADPRVLTNTVRQRTRLLANLKARRELYDMGDEITEGTLIEPPKGMIFVRNPDVAPTKLSPEIKLAIENPERYQRVTSPYPSPETLQQWFDEWIYKGDGPQPAWLKDVANVRLVPESVIRTRLIDAFPSAPRGSVGALFGTLNSLARTVVIYTPYLGARYIARNTPQNMILLALTQPKAFRNLGQAVRGLRRNDPELYGAIKVEVGDVPASAGLPDLPGAKRNWAQAIEAKSVAGQRRIANTLGEVSDEPWRVSSWIEYMRKADYSTPAEWRQALYSDDPNVIRFRDAIAQRVREDMLDFDALSPFERETISRYLFIYPFVKGAGKWPLMYLREYPTRSAVIALLTAQHAREDVPGKVWDQGKVMIAGKLRDLGWLDPTAPARGTAEALVGTVKAVPEGPSPVLQQFSRLLAPQYKEPLKPYGGWEGVKRSFIPGYTTQEKIRRGGDVGDQVLRGLGVEVPTKATQVDKRREAFKTDLERLGHPELLNDPGLVLAFKRQELLATALEPADSSKEKVLAALMLARKAKLLTPADLTKYKAFSEASTDYENDLFLGRISDHLFGGLALARARGSINDALRTKKLEPTDY